MVFQPSNDMQIKVIKYETVYKYGTVKPIVLTSVLILCEISLLLLLILLKLLLWTWSWTWLWMTNTRFLTFSSIRITFFITSSTSFTFIFTFVLPTTTSLFPSLSIIIPTSTFESISLSKTAEILWSATAFPT